MKFLCLGLQGKRVCDIGSGTGCAGLVAAALGATVVLTDQEVVLDLMKGNRDRCLADGIIQPGQVDVQVFNWDEEPDPNILPVDVVLVSDCVLPKLYPIDLLIRAVDRVIGADSVAIFSYEHRPYPLFDPRIEFERIAESYNLSVKVVPLEEHDSIYRCEDIEIWRVFRKDKFPSLTMNLHLEELLQVEEWGDSHPSIPCVLRFKMNDEDDVVSLTIPVSQSSASRGVIGSYLWPSSVIASRQVSRCSSL